MHHMAPHCLHHMAWHHMACTTLLAMFATAPRVVLWNAQLGLYLVSVCIIQLYCGEDGVLKAIVKPTCGEDNVVGFMSFKR